MAQLSDAPVALVTGCSDGGIGSALCKALLDRRYTVFATARDVSKMASLRGRPGAHLLPLDVTDSASVRQAVADVIKMAGRIDVLINNAGVGLVAPLVEGDLKEARRLFDANYFGLLDVTQQVVPHMAQRGSGTILNVGSVTGLIPVPWSGVYSSSKAAVHSLTDCLRVELAPFGIRVVLVVPGAVQSGIGANNLARLDNSAWRLYRPWQEAIQWRATASQTVKSTPTDVFADEVVRRVLGRRTPPAWVILGRMSTLFRVVLWLPTWVQDFMLSKAAKVVPVPRPEVLAAAADAAVAALGRAGSS